MKIFCTTRGAAPQIVPAKTDEPLKVRAFWHQWGFAVEIEHW